MPDKSPEQTDHTKAYCDRCGNAYALAERYMAVNGVPAQCETIISGTRCPGSIIWPRKPIENE